MRRDSVQYELNIKGYEEVRKEKQKKADVKKLISSLVLIVAGGLMLGRINLLLNQSDVKGIAPFGLAYLMAVILMSNSRAEHLAAGLGTVLGYLSVIDAVSSGYKYIIAASVITLSALILPIRKKKQKQFLEFTMLMVTFLAYGYFVSGYPAGADITFCLMECAVLAPVYYVIKYAVSSIEEFDPKYMFSTEQLISIGILACLIVSGLSGITILGFSLKTVIALFLVLSISYIGGAPYGTLIGVSMGLIIGAASGDMQQSIAFFGIGGLIVGIFKDTGKIFSCIAAVIIYAALGVYSNSLSVSFVFEVSAGCIVFLCIPKKVFKDIEESINLEKKAEAVNENKIADMRHEFSCRLRGITTVLDTISDSLGTINDNEKLTMKNRGSALVERLADRCCSRCENNAACWRRNFQQTYNSFQTLLASCEEKSICLPGDLQRNCVQPLKVMKYAEAITDSNSVDEIVKSRLAEGRRLLSYHVRNISDTVNSLFSNFKKNVHVDFELEKKIRLEFNKRGINYNDVFCYRDINGRIKMKISLDNYMGAEYIRKRILPIADRLSGRKLCLCEDESCINTENDEYVISLHEEAAFNILSYSSYVPKDGEEIIGDSYAFGTTPEGGYMTVLSDGMGFGPEAGKESSSTVALVERFIEAGFDEEATINTVNSIMGMRFAENEKYATLDLGKFDLYTGEASFVKIGAVSTFIKRGREIIEINSRNLPFGLLEEPETEIITEKLQAGDMVISVTDGVLDIDMEDIDERSWLENFLKIDNSDPKELSDKILDKAKELSGGIIKDDMTVLVSKVYKAG